MFFNLCSRQICRLNAYLTCHYGVWISNKPGLLLTCRRVDVQACCISSDFSQNEAQPTTAPPPISPTNTELILPELPERKIGVTKQEQKKLLKTIPQQPPNPHMLKVAIIGAPNAGKSTLANKLLGWKFSSVSQKVHTTRKRTLGVLTEGDTQVVFLDTPGMVTSQKTKKHNLNRSLMTDPHSSLFEADLIAVVQDISTPWGKSRIDEEVLKALYVHKDTKSVLILNKVDAITWKRKLLQITRQLTNGIVGGTRDSHLVSAKEDQKKERLKRLTEMEYVQDQNYGSSWWKLENESTQGSESNLDATSSAHVIHKQNSDTTTGKIEKEANVNEVNDSNYEQENNINGSSGDKHLSETDVNRCSETSPELSLMKDIRPLSKDSNNDDVNKESFTVFSTDSVKEKQESFSDSSDSEDDRFLKISGDLRKNEIWREYSHYLQVASRYVKGKSGWPHFDEVFMISALHGDGILDLKEYMLCEAQPGWWQYHPAVVTDQNPLEVARQCILEKLMDHVPDEIPYNLNVEVVLWEEEDGCIRTAFDITCKRQRYLFHTLGKGGETIRKVALEAKQELMNAFRQDMTVKLIVKNQKDKF